MSKPDTGIVNIHGKQYKTVALRVLEFREKYPLGSIESAVLSAGELVQVRATIKDEDGRVIATGLAEELRGSTNINKTSALENAETSAVGRALAFFGLGGTEIASADEVANAIAQQAEFDLVEKLKRHNAAVREHIVAIYAIKEGLANDDYDAAYGAFSDLTNDTLDDLRIATTKGGIFTTEEGARMKSNEWTKARLKFHGLNEEIA